MQNYINYYQKQIRYISLDAFYSRFLQDGPPLAAGPPGSLLQPLSDLLLEAPLLLLLPADELGHVEHVRVGPQVHGHRLQPGGGWPAGGGGASLLAASLVETGSSGGGEAPSHSSLGAGAEAPIARHPGGVWGLGPMAKAHPSPFFSCLLLKSKRQTGTMRHQTLLI